MSIVCEEIFDESSHPSIEEIKDYASKIGIDPDSEPHLLPLATEGLMKALPPDWKPCYDEKSKSYYYYNNLTKKTQWEHPLDDIYRGLVKKARAESQSLSLNEPHTEDTFNIRDDIPSYEEAAPLSSKKLDPILLGARKKEIKLSPLKVSPHTSPKRDLFQKQRSEDYLLEKGKFTLTTFNSFDNDNEIEQMEENFTKHPQNFPKELKVTGGGAMFLKSNTKKAEMKSDTLDPQPKGILRERGIEHSRSMEFDKLSILEKSDKDDEEKKSVRFNLDTNNTDDIGITLSDKSSSESEIKSEDKDIINVNISEKKEKSRFTISSVPENSLKLIKPYPTDYIKPKLTISRGSDSDEDSILKSKNSLFSDSSSSDNPLEGNFQEKAKKIEDRAERKMNLLKQNIWEEKSEELLKFKQGLKESHKNEKERILEDEQIIHDEELKSEREKLQFEFEKQKKSILAAEKLKIEQKLESLKEELENNFKLEEVKLKEHFDGKREELEKYYDEKLADIEKELADKVEKTREDLLASHNSTIEELKQNHVVIMDEVRRELHAEEQVLRQEHQARIAELKNRDIESRTDSQSERMYEKVRCEKRLLEDKYRCLKEKYLRLKTEVKMSIEKRNRRKEGSATTNTTGSETEQSHSNNKDRTPLNSPSHKIMEKPPTPKHSRQDSVRKVENKSKVQLQELDTSASDCYQSDANRNDSSDSTNHGRSRKKMFSRLKSSSTSRINNNNMKKKPQRSCSPVENLRRQLQKLEDLEDQFPQNPQSDTYHLRYPFSDGGQKFEGSSELEFFRHRIHLERDSIKRAKESLRSQKALFQQRQNELKLKHGSMARHTLQQLCHEEKELTDMEVSLHRTRSLLGEKVIRLRHLEQSLQRANIASNDVKQEDATLSDLSSHSASSGISSTEFAAAESNYNRAILRGDHLQESSEIIQSLENLNSEIQEIWDVLRTQQQQSNIASVMPPLVYPDMGWPILAGSANMPAPPSIPTLADRLHNYRQHVALANAQSTVVTHAANQGATTTLVERTRNLRHWLRQTGIDVGAENQPPQATL